MTVDFNLNWQVQVQLTEHGLHSLHEQGFDAHPDQEGWTTFQLHEVMHLFGDEMYNGNNHLPFRPCMRLCLPDESRNGHA